MVEEEENDRNGGDFFGVALALVGGGFPGISVGIGATYSVGDGFLVGGGFPGIGATYSVGDGFLVSGGGGGLVGGGVPVL